MFLETKSRETLSKANGSNRGGKEILTLLTNDVQQRSTFRGSRSELFPV